MYFSAFAPGSPCGVFSPLHSLLSVWECRCPIGARRSWVQSGCRFVRRQPTFWAPALCCVQSLELGLLPLSFLSDVQSPTGPKVYPAHFHTFRELPDKLCLLVWAEEAARRGELQVGDILVQAEDQKITASSVYEVASLLLGPPGTVVQIKVKRAPASGHVGGQDELHHVVELERKQTSFVSMHALVEANRDPGAARSPAPPPPCDGTSIVI